MKILFNRFFKTILLVFIGILSLLFFNSCRNNDNPSPIVEEIITDVPSRWATMTLKITEKTPSNTPTYASRGFGYLGLTMYESVVNGYTDYKSLAGQLNGLNSLPKPIGNTKYNWIETLNASQAYMLKNIYEQTSDANKASIDSLEKVIKTEILLTENQVVVDSSMAYGQRIAKAIFEWSKTDGGYKAYQRNFDINYVIPKNAWNWTPPTFSQSASKLPLHPYWGQNRPFLVADSLLSIPSPVAYSNLSTSQYYAQMLEVYAKNKALTQEEKELALWWSDDPSRTFTPPGHSYSLATITVKTAKPTLIKATQTFAVVGIGIADAFVNCWKAKYKYVLERPTAFINKFIDPSYTQFWPEPPFPAFYSGHSVQAGAMATVLTPLYGTAFSFIDNSHEGRAIDPLTGISFKNRSFSSFWDAANEIAYSRFLGGIHNRSDNDTGLTEGTKIGQNINKLQWKK